MFLTSHEFKNRFRDWHDLASRHLYEKLFSSLLDRSGLMGMDMALVEICHHRMDAAPGLGPQMLALGLQFFISCNNCLPMDAE